MAKGTGSPVSHGNDIRHVSRNCISPLWKADFAHAFMYPPKEKAVEVQANAPLAFHFFLTRACSRRCRLCCTVFWHSAHSRTAGRVEPTKVSTSLLAAPPAMLITGAPSLRYKKKNPTASSLRRSTSSPFATDPRRKPVASLSKTKSAGEIHDSDDAIFDEALDDTGVLASLALDISLKDVAQFTENIHRRMFDAVPDRASGMSSARIAGVLNFRKRMPPIVTLAHVHAVSHSTTRADREIAEMTQAAVIRKLLIPNRGKGSSDVGEALVLVSDWEKRVRSHEDLEDGLKEKYVSVLRSSASSLVVPATVFTATEASALTSSGFLTSSTQGKATSADILSRPGAGTFSTLTSLAYVGHKSAAGSVDAVGGSGAFTSSGASAGGSVYRNNSASRSAEYRFALPDTGPYLKLLVEARAHLLSLLAKSSRHKEATMTALRERWNGGIALNDAAARARQDRGEIAGVLPGKTKKWRSFHGLRFDWILEECVGAGLLECFETGSVGVGVRATA